MPLASCLPTLSAPSQTSPQLLFVCFVARSGVLFHKSMYQKARIKKQESKSKNPKQKRTPRQTGMGIELRHFLPTKTQSPKPRSPWSHPEGLGHTFEAPWPIQRATLWPLSPPANPQLQALARTAFAAVRPPPPSRGRSESSGFPGA